MALELPEIIQRVSVVVDTKSLRNLAQQSRDASAAQKDLGDKTDTSTKSMDMQRGSVDRDAASVGKLTDATRSHSRETERNTQVVKESTRVHRDHDAEAMHLFHSLNLAGGATAALGESMKLLKAPAIIGAIKPLVGGFEALAGQVFALGASLAEVGNLVGVVPAGLLSIGLAGGTLKLVLGGIGDEAKALNKAAMEGPAEYAKAIAAMGEGTKAILIPLQGMRAEFKGIKEEARSALVEGGLGQALADVASRGLPVFRQAMLDTSVSIGKAFKSVTDVITSDDFLGKFALFAKNNQPIIENLGVILGNLAKVFMNLALAAQPIIQQISDMVRGWSEHAAAASEAGLRTGELTDKFQSAWDKARQLGRIILDLVRGIGELGGAVRPFGDTLLDGIERMAQKFHDWAADTATQGKFMDFLNQTKPVVTEIVGLVGDLVRMLVRVGTEGGGGLAPLINRLRTEVLPLIERIIESVGGDFLNKLVDLGVALLQIFAAMAGSSGPLTIYVEALTALAKGVGWLVDNVPGFKQFVFAAIVLSSVFKITTTFGFVRAIEDMVAAARTGAGPVGALTEGVKKLYEVGWMAGAGAGAGPVGAVASGLGLVAVAMAAVTAATIGAVAIWNYWNADAREAQQIHSDLTKTFQDETKAVYEGVDAVIAKRVADHNQNDDLRALGLTTNDLTDAALGHKDAIEKVLDAQLKLGGQQGLLLISTQGLNDGQTRMTDVTSELSGRFTELFQQTGDINSAFAILQTEYAATHAGATLSLQGNTDLIDSYKLTGEQLQKYTEQTAEAAIAQGKLTEAEYQAIVAAHGQADGQIDYAGVLEDVRAKLNAKQRAEETATRATEAAKVQTNLLTGAYRGLKGAVDDYLGKGSDLQAAADAEIAGEQAIQAAIDAHTTSLDENTEEGRANRDMIRQGVDAEWNYIDAFLKGGGTIEEAGNKVEQYRGRLIDQLMQMGLNKDQAIDYANTLLGTPADVLTTLRLADQEARNKIAEDIAKLNNTDGTGIPKEVTSQLIIDVKERVPGAMDRAKQTLSWFAQHNGDTFTYNVNVVTSRTGPTGGFGSEQPQSGGWLDESAHVMRRAMGGVIGAQAGFVTRGPTVLVGEGNRAYPEYIIPTDPRYRNNALSLLTQVASKIARPPIETTTTRTAAAAMPTGAAIVPDTDAEKALTMLTDIRDAVVAIRDTTHGAEPFRAAVLAGISKMTEVTDKVISNATTYLAKIATNTAATSTGSHGVGGGGGGGGSSFEEPTTPQPVSTAGDAHTEMVNKALALAQSIGGLGTIEPLISAINKVLAYTTDPNAIQKAIDAFLNNLRLNPGLYAPPPPAPPPPMTTIAGPVAPSTGATRGSAAPAPALVIESATFNEPVSVDLVFAKAATAQRTRPS